jgi:hypothetical protein
LRSFKARRVVDVVPTGDVHQHDLAGREELTAPTDARARRAAAAADRPSRFDHARDDVVHCGGVLRGTEWELFRVGLSTLWDDIELQEADEEPCTTEVDGFDRRTRPERLALLAQVAKGLHDRREPCADLTAFNEAAIAAALCASGEVHLQSAVTSGDDSTGGASGPVGENTPCLEPALSIYAGTPSSMTSAVAA